MIEEKLRNIDSEFLGTGRIHLGKRCSKKVGGIRYAFDTRDRCFTDSNGS